VSDAVPPLRPIEAFPVEQEGRRYVALRDPAGYTSAIVMLPLPLVEVVAWFDGRRSVGDIQEEVMRRRGELVPRDKIAELAEALDANGFLASEGFEARRAAIDAEFLAAPTRPASHAGGAYADEPGALRTAFDRLFDPPAGPGPVAEGAADAAPVRGVIAPHIDFHRGGPAYAWAYREVGERSDADLFVVFGTCHAGMADPFALTRKDFDTPLGPVAVDRDLAEAVAARAGQDCFGSELAHRTEHSIEFQAVFLRYLLGDRRPFTILPVLASYAHQALADGRPPEDDPRVPRFVDALRDAVARAGRRVAYVAGADLAHVGPRFGDPAPIGRAELARVESEDRAMLAEVEAGDADAFFRAVARDNDRRRICGLSPIHALLVTLGGTPGRLRRYGQWPDPQGVVTFASVVF
jgi:hypothetical protein